MAPDHPAPEHLPPHRVARDRMATWKIVAITLGAVIGALGLFGAGFVAGVATSSVAQSSGTLPGGSGGGGTGGGGADPAPTGGDPGGGGAASEFDDCLVGTWRTTDYEQRTTGPDGESVLTGLNRTFTFDESGRHVVTYDEVEATLTTPGGTSALVFDGTVVYRVALSGSRMSFTLESAKGSMTVRPEQGKEEVRDLQPGTGAVTYTCEGDTYTEEDGKGFREMATRVS
ncbi:hypothetical protein GCM10023153_16090 [Ornithinibacter aureus]|uniref:Uncharacterized protein n=1 Tax=Ornithinibacter aureus TaxID=622664 RepID=A0ABP8JR10_9MICO|nr:hypothetical protein [Ornithinibacter aureus]KAF0834425.1 hypothetical protein C8E84_2249 [Ornithinibacter aureus]